jgi:glycosidase
MKHLYELHTAAWLSRLTNEHGYLVTLHNVPDDEVERIASYHIDTIWLMGVWERSPVAAEISRRDKGLVDEIHRLLPDMSDEDIIGSAYAVKSYTVDQQFGGQSGLAMFRSQLAEKNIKLILDFVPNHTAFDNAWVAQHPDYYITANVTQATARPDVYYVAGGIAVAKGADPNLAPWPDVAQLNGYSTGYRHASVETLRTIAQQCDGVRCDMAMLLLNDVVARAWGSAAGERPSDEYWQTVIDQVRDTSPSFIFIAECYWDTERHLVSLGFDYCYDKTLYDCMTSSDNSALRNHIDTLGDIAPNLVHFLENHDEQRAATIFNLQEQAKYAHLITTLPGPCLWYDGQFSGYTAKLPTHVRRGPAEPTNPEIKAMYEDLLRRLQADAHDIPQSPLHTDAV